MTEESIDRWLAWSPEARPGSGHLVPGSDNGRSFSDQWLWDRRPALASDWSTVSDTGIWLVDTSGCSPVSRCNDSVPLRPRVTMVTRLWLQQTQSALITTNTACIIQWETLLDFRKRMSWWCVMSHQILICPPDQAPSEAGRGRARSGEVRVSPGLWQRPIIFPAITFV